MGEAADAEQTGEQALAERGWVRHLGELCTLLDRAPSGTLLTVSATIRLNGQPGEGLLLLDVCAGLGRRHGLDLAVRHPGAAATYTVLLRRGVGTPARV